VTDDEFVRAFEACEIANTDFHHRDHIRLAWIYVRRHGAVAAAERIAQSIRNFAAHHGKSDKFHQTITDAWVLLVAEVANSLPATASFDEAATRFPRLLDKNYVRNFYSEAVLNSVSARKSFVPPDLRPLP
jgi:hypothetical protein